MQKFVPEAKRFTQFRSFEAFFQDFSRTTDQKVAGAFMGAFVAFRVLCACLSKLELRKRLKFEDRNQNGTLVTQPCDPPPPYPAIGYSSTYRIYIQFFWVSQGIALYPPSWGVSQNYVEGGRILGGGVPQVSAALSAMERYREGIFAGKR